MWVGEGCTMNQEKGQAFISSLRINISGLSGGCSELCNMMKSFNVNYNMLFCVFKNVLCKF